MTAIDSETDEGTVEALPDQLRFLVDEDLQDKVYNFLTGYFLCWLEALSLLKLTDDGINSLEFLERLVNDAAGGAKLRDFVRDARQFILDYKSDVIEYPLRIYPNAVQRVRSGSMKEIHIPKLQAWGSRSSEAWGTLVTILEGHTSAVFDLAFSPDGKLLASGFGDGKVRLWDLHINKRYMETFIGHDGEVSAVAFSPDSRLLASAAYDNMVKIWDLATGEVVQEVSGGYGDDDFRITSVVFAPGGQLVAFVSFSSLKLWDLTTGEVRGKLYSHEDSICIAFSPDGRQLACSTDTMQVDTYESSVEIWELHTATN
ncbi:hypothetical protein V494_04899 [Pseudogymnoascus sp. VKM F-4513 (FW-928)]|nr:hypothetical protein V494_04899 [Pseudogymnoascus sp. VKM F-4513 (FW-928)]